MYIEVISTAYLQAGRAYITAKFLRAVYIIRASLMLMEEGLYKIR